MHIFSPSWEGRGPDQGDTIVMEHTLWRQASFRSCPYCSRGPHGRDEGGWMQWKALGPRDSPSQAHRAGVPSHPGLLRTEDQRILSVRASMGFESPPLSQILPAILGRRLPTRHCFSRFPSILRKGWQERSYRRTGGQGEPASSAAVCDWQPSP